MNIPPPSIRRYSFAGAEIKRYLLLGQSIKDALLGLAKDQRAAPQAILDHGSRCGIVLRHWPVSISGVDNHEECVAWCQRHLPHKVSLVSITQPLMIGTFDMIYSSLFLNMSEEDQDFSLEELSRALKPSGLLMVLLRGERESMLCLSADERKRFEDGQLVVRNAEVSGRTDCTAFHPKSYAMNRFASVLPVVGYQPAQTLRIDGQPASLPAIIVLRKLG